MMKTALITAYDVNPYKGSESGTGWNISKEIAKDFKVIVVTRKNNQGEIDRYLTENDDSIHSNMQFEYYDLPNWTMFWKKKLGPRGYVLYFYLWQLFMPLFIRSKKLKFDIAHALNFHSDSHPNFLWLFGKPTIWGPIGHHPKMPKEYITHYGNKTVNTDKKYAIVKWIMRNLDPFFYLSKWKSDKIIGINSSIQPTLRVKDSKIEIIPAVATEKPEKVERTTSQFNVLSVGRFTSMKGFDVTILSFVGFLKQLPKQQQKEVKLTLVGSGEDQEYLNSLIKLHNIEKSVNIINWVERKEMKTIYSNADVFLFPSHEGAGMVVPEAMSYGLPVLCFDNVGPGELVKNAGIKISYSNYNNSIKQFSEKLYLLYKNEDIKRVLGEKSYKIYQNNYTWESKGEKIKTLYRQLLKENKTIAVFHPSAELYGADRIMVNALNAVPKSIKKRVYLFREGPLVNFIKNEVANVEVIVTPSMPIIYRKIFTPKGIIKFVTQWINFLMFFRKENKQFHFQSAYVNTLSSSFILPQLWLLKIKRFVHVHEIIDNPKIIGFVTALFSYLFANKIVCVSKAVQDGLSKYVKLTHKKSIVIHNGINPVEVTKFKERKNINFYLFGRIKPEKGQWFLIDTLATIPKEKLQNCKFILMGGVVDGQEDVLKRLQDKITIHGLNEYVFLRDFAPNIADAMSDADVCLIPSLMKDPFPTTVLEAMSAAKPVITTNHGGAKEAVLNNETGFLVSPNNTKELASSILYLIDRKTQIDEIGAKAKTHYQNFFTTEHFNTNWLNFNLNYQLI